MKELPSHCRRKYRKYTPWIYFIIEIFVIAELWYLLEVLTGFGLYSMILFVLATLWSMSKLVRVLKRQREYRSYWFLKEE